MATVEPEGLAPVNTAPQWETVELAVDSGASETVIPTGLLRGVSLQPSDASRRGVTYQVANGQEIPALGEKHVYGSTHSEGYGRSITAQVCNVRKPLMSVHKLVTAGHRVVFDEPGAYIENKTTKERIQLQESGGMYVLKLWVHSSGKGTDAGF